MFRKLAFINTVIALIFLSATIFPSSLFPMKESSESTYEKVRCPRCSIEFYYVPGKEGPHSHWVHYEVPDKGSGKGEPASGKEGIGTSGQSGQGKGLLGLFKQKETVEEKIATAPSESEISFSQIERPQLKEYELRQRLTCPYDGYSFFPEGDVIEARKLMQKAFTEEPSIIESSFAKSIPFGVSKELRQFGYDLFITQEQETKDREPSGRDKTAEADAISALGMLKSVFNPSSGAEPYSVGFETAQTAVVPIGPDYVIGPGDTLVVNVWGSVQESFPVEVDREGKIMLPKAGPLYLWGLKFEEAENRITERLNKFYTNFNVDVSMGKIRDIKVYVLGEVNMPGAYGLNPQSTILQALYAAGGPTKLGSLRKIKLIHGDGTQDKIDLYPFLLEGENIVYSRIRSGDTIFVPAIGDVVAIAGNVKRPAIFETKSNILLGNVLSFAGGITPTGDMQRLQVERIVNNERRVMADLELAHTDIGEFSLKDIWLQNGDMIIVSPIVRLKHDFVSILGNVERPGDYALSKDMKLSDLIKRAKGFMPGTYMYRAEISRVTEDRTREIIPVNLEKMALGAKEEDRFLNEWDILLIYSEAEVKPPSFVEISGAVNRPGNYELTPGMKVSDLIFKGGGIKPAEVIRGAELFHIMPGEQPAVRNISLSQVSDIDVMVDKDIVLRAGDALFIKSEPKLTERKAISIEDEVRFPGTFAIREGERLSSLIERAGGYTKDAFLEGAFFTRETIREMQEKMRNEFLEKETRTLLEEQQAILLQGSNKGIVASTATTETLDTRRQMLEFIESVEIEGRMVIKLLPLSELKGSKHDILLEDGDRLRIPQTPSAVAIMGSVNNPMSIPFEQARGIEYYIRKSGGVTRHADKSAIYVIHANGEAESKFMMSKTVGRGDTIVVPQRFKYIRPAYDIFKDTVDMISRIAIGIGIIAALD